MSENKETKNGWGILFVAVSVVVILWTLNWVLLSIFGGEGAEKGQFGDMFGSVNALFSGLAFAFLIYTIWLQREELQLQREELKMQRKALELQAEELKRQADELAKTTDLQAQTFELQQQQLDLTKSQIEENKSRFKSQNEPKLIKTELGVSHSSSRYHIYLKLRNSGEDAFDLKFESTEILKNMLPYPQIVKGGELQFNWVCEAGNLPEAINTTINYTNKDNDKGAISFVLRKTQETDEIYTFETN